MASATAALIGSMVVVVLLLRVSPSADARPCKSILISYSFPIERIPNPKPDPNPNPNPNLDLLSSRFLVFTSTSTYFNPRPSFLTFDLDDRLLPQLPRHRHVYPGVPLRIARSETENKVDDENQLGWFDLRSFRDRAVDILSVVFALLFGVGCGSLTAATLFLVWFLCSNNRGEGFEDEEEEEDDLSSIKKMGYVKMADDVKIPPEPVKA